MKTRQRVEHAARLGNPCLLPSDGDPDGHQRTFKTVWRLTLQRDRCVGDEWVMQLLRQGDAKVFKKYSR